MHWAPLRLQAPHSQCDPESLRTGRWFHAGTAGKQLAEAARPTVCLDVTLGPRKDSAPCLAPSMGAGISMLLPPISPALVLSGSQSSPRWAAGCCPARSSCSSSPELRLRPGGCAVGRWGMARRSCQPALPGQPHP